MINLHPASSRYSADRGWLKSSFSFSFGDFYDPANTSFGPLCVLNDDIVAGGKGFGAHPHREMEIVTIVLRGQLKHEDNTGHSAITTFGQIQRMSAGTGIIHSEVNPGDEEVSLLQLWFMPNEKKLSPSYETTNYDIGQLTNHLLPVVSNHSSEKIAHIYQDMTIYLSDLEPGRSLEFNQAAGRRIFIFVIEGSLSLNGTSQLNKRDSARIEEIAQLHIQTDAGAFIMIIDLP